MLKRYLACPFTIILWAAIIASATIAKANWPLPKQFPTKTITIQTPYLIGDYVTYKASDILRIPAGKGNVAAICVDADEISYMVCDQEKQECQSGVTLGMINE